MSQPKKIPLEIKVVSDLIIPIMISTQQANVEVDDADPNVTVITFEFAAAQLIMLELDQRDGDVYLQQGYVMLRPGRIPTFAVQARLEGQAPEAAAKLFGDTVDSELIRVDMVSAGAGRRDDVSARPLFEQIGPGSFTARLIARLLEAQLDGTAGNHRQVVQSVIHEAQVAA